MYGFALYIYIYYIIYIVLISSRWFRSCFFSFLTKDTRWFPFPTRESLRWTGPEANFLRWALRDADAQGAEGLLSTWLVISFFDFSIRSQKTVVYSCMKIFLYNIYIYNVYIILEYLGNKMARTDLGGFPWRMAEASGCEWWWNHRCEQP